MVLTKSKRWCGMSRKPVRYDPDEITRVSRDCLLVWPAITSFRIICNNNQTIALTIINVNHRFGECFFGVEEKIN